MEHIVSRRFGISSSADFGLVSDFEIRISDFQAKGDASLPFSYTKLLPIFRGFSKGAIVAVRIRMKKMGRKHRPYFRIVAIDSRQPRDGRTLEDLGTYDPMVENQGKPRHAQARIASSTG